MSRVTLSSILVMLCSLSLFTGCASVMSYNAGAQEKAMQIARAKQDTAAIQVISMGGSAIGVGINVNELDVITAHPWRTLGAAILDVATGAAAYKLFDNYTSNSSKKEVTINGNGNSYSETTGDGNSSTHSNEEDSHNGNL